MIYGYARCSTNERQQDINRQVRELLAQGCTEETIYREYEKGTRTDRPELLKLQSILAEGDTLIALEVSRITRSTRQLCDIVEFAAERRIKLILGGIVVDCTGGVLNPFTEAVIKILGVVAELERNMISERVKSGIANARAKGKTLGRSKTGIEDIPPVFMRYYKQYEAREITASELARLSQTARSTTYKYIGVIGLCTPQKSDV